MRERVHASGSKTLRRDAAGAAVEHDEIALGDLVDRLSRRFEATVGRDWRFEMDRDDHREQLRGIIGFRFAPTRIALKFKLSQNHPPANRRAVREDLAARDDTGARAVARLMRASDAGDDR